MNAAWRRLALPPPAVTLVLALSCLLCLAIALSQPVDIDEHMYLAAARSVGEAQLYDDVAFFQPPYAAWTYAGWLAILPGDHVLLPARLLKALLAAGLVLALYRLLRRFGAPAPLAAALVLLIVHLTPVRLTVGLARNYDLAQLAILLAVLLLPLRPGDREGRARLLAAGALAGAAVGFKLTYAAPAAVVVAWPLIAPTTLEAGRREAVWTLAGALLGLLPLLLALLFADPAAVRFDLVDYHLLNARWHAQAGLGQGLDLRGKLHDLRRLYRETDLACLLALSLTALVLVRLRGRDWSRTVWRLALALLGAGALMVAVPRPVQTAYYVPSLLALTMLVAVAAVRLDEGPRRLLTAVAVLAALVCVGHQGADDLRRLGRLGQAETWPAVRLHAAGRNLAELTASHRDRAVATTHPLYVLESGRPLEPRFATGVFAWRLGELLDRERQERFRLVTPQTFGELMATRPASAVIVVAVGPWDEPLGAWARAAGWRPAPLAGGVVAWLPQAAGATDPPPAHSR